MVRRLVVMALVAQAVPAIAAENAPALTIYNQDFAVVREIVPLNLTSGINEVSFADTTAHLEPDSVILRDPTRQHELRIYEQNFRGDPISEGLLLSIYEGKTIDFLTVRDQQQVIVPGRIVRSGYMPHYAAMNQYNREYYQRQMQMSQGGQSQPIIEIDGKLRFGLPGTPLFPELTDETILKPTLHWKLATDQPGSFDAELAYVTGGMRWDADYNIVAPEKGDRVDLVGWVTMDNQSGRTFDNAHIKLIAGDVNKIQSQTVGGEMLLYSRASNVSQLGQAVTEKSFDEYHMYTLAQAATLRDRETKQVEFVRAAGVRADRLYVYDGAAINPQQYSGWSAENRRSQPDYGTQSNPKVWVMLEFENSKANGLGMPLPKGRLRFYRQDDDGRLEFTGEDLIDHTPRDETIRVYTGNAFDITGERTRTNFEVDSKRDQLDESFRIKLRNHKDEPVEVRVVEHLYRWSNWEIKKASDDYVKNDSRTIEFRVSLKPDEEKAITYTAHYWW
ncbi:MAG: DUF4139 domain-containing protein [Phycisphaerales bacterium]|nr:DUF4139 domain-containing protein [Phycisphaerales bacterium]